MSNNKTLVLNCRMGIAGDMTSAALLELMPDKEAALNELNSLNLPGVIYKSEDKISHGISGTHMHVFINGEEEACHKIHHHHMNLLDVKNIIFGADVSFAVKKNAFAIYDIIAAAESKAHNCTVEEVHFHEVGAMDAIADVMSVCCLMESLGSPSVIAADIHVGFGTVKCEHGILPIPAPATAHILNGINYSTGEVKGELCTPTGAAVLKHFASKIYKEIPHLPENAKCGIGIGTKDFGVPNCLKAYLF